MSPPSLTIVDPLPDAPPALSCQRRLWTAPYVTILGYFKIICGMPEYFHVGERLKQRSFRIPPAYLQQVLRNQCPHYPPPINSFSRQGRSNTPATPRYFIF